MGINATSAPEASRELLHRVASSPQFQRSKRLRDLLLYLGERSLQDPNCILHEQDIGVDVLGRPRDYDTSHDTLVRVQVSQLRKKLQDHFAAEGRHEHLVIEIPKGSYVPVFRTRDQSARESDRDARPPAPPPARRRVYAIAVALLLVLAGTAWVSRGALFGIRANAKPRPTVDTFWRQVFGNGQTTYLVLSDVTLIEFQKLIGGPIGLSEYESREFDRLAGERIADPVTRALAREFVNRVTTAVSDVQVARDFGVIAAEKHYPLNLISARDLSSSLISSQNIVLLGSWRANPWVGLFENQMTFRTDYQESPPSVRFVNQAPLPGEQPAYQAEWRKYGYCRVTYLPNPKHAGSVLLISGSDVISSEAGGRFVTSEESLGDLRQKLGVKTGEPFPHFEVLLRTQVVNSTVPWFEVVAHRRHQ